jgi:hypothetical protein
MRLIFYTCPRRAVHGIQLVVPAAEPDDTERFFAAVTNALELIQRTDPRRWRHVRNELRRMVLVNGGGESYHRGLQAYVVDLPTLRTRSQADLAATIIHEATHGRLYRWGIGYTPELRERIERVCVGEEISFLKRLSGTESLVEKRLADLMTKWWTDDALHDRRLQGFRANYVPGFIVQIIDRLYRARRQA